MPVNLTTLSKILDVAPGTISRVLNNRASQRISEARRKYIVEGAKKYGYKPNVAARSLSMQKTFNVGWLQHNTVGGVSIVNPNQTVDMMASLDYELRKQHFGLTVLSISRDNPESSFNQLVREHRTFDALVFPPGMAEKGMLDIVTECEVPFAVMLDKRIREWPGNFFDIDWIADSKTKIQHLLELGHKNIGLVDWDSRGRLAHDTLSKYVVDLLIENHLPVKDKWIITVTPGCDELYSFRDYGREAMRRIFACGELPTAIIASTDMAALGLADVIKEHGLEVGRDIALIGFGNLEGLASISHHKPILTSLEPAYKEIGKITAQILMEQIANKATPCRRQLVPSKLVIRSSTVWQTENNGKEKNAYGEKPATPSCSE